MAYEWHRKCLATKGKWQKCLAKVENAVSVVVWFWYTCILIWRKHIFKWNSVQSRSLNRDSPFDYMVKYTFWGPVNKNTHTQTRKKKSKTEAYKICARFSFGMAGSLAMRFNDDLFIWLVEIGYMNLLENTSIWLWVDKDNLHFTSEFFFLFREKNHAIFPISRFVHFIFGPVQYTP